MTYVVNSDHVENLRGGRMVGPGEEVSDAIAKQNPKLIDRGVLVKRLTGVPDAASKPASPTKSQTKKASGVAAAAPANDTAAQAPQSPKEGAK